MKNPIALVSGKFSLLSMLFGVVLSTAFAFKVLKDKPACAIALHKQNVFYIGVDNPISIVTRGIPEEQLIVDAKGVMLQKGEGDNYIVRATTPGEGVITVSGGDMEPMAFKFRVKRIPDPVPLLGGTQRSGGTGNGNFRVYKGIAAVLQNFDFDAKCDVVSYEVTYNSKGHDPVSRINSGSRFGSDTQEWINKAKPGDLYFFDDIKVKCPGDGQARDIGSLSFRIR